MALGTTIKVRADTKDVSRGLAGIRGMFSRLGGAVRGFGRGAARAGRVAGASLVGIGIAAALSFKSIAQMGGELSDLSTQTGTSVEKLLQLREAMRLAGVDGQKAGLILSKLGATLQTATENPKGPEFAAFEKLGLLSGKLVHLPLEQQFSTLMEVLAGLPEGFIGLESAMEDIFGGRVGFNLLKLAKNFPEEMARASQNMKSFGPLMARSSDDLDKIADNFARVKQLYSELVLRVITKLPLDKISAFLDGLDFEGIGGAVVGLAHKAESLFKNTAEFLAQSVSEAGKNAGQAFSNAVKGAAEEIGNMIGEGIKSALPSGGILNLIPGLSSITPGRESPGESLGPKIERTNQLLERGLAAPARYA